MMTTSPKRVHPLLKHLEGEAIDDFGLETYFQDEHFGSCLDSKLLSTLNIAVLYNSIYTTTSDCLLPIFAGTPHRSGYIISLSLGRNSS